MFSFILTNDGTISVFGDNKNFVVGPDNPRYQEAKQALQDQNLEMFKEICEKTKIVAEYFNDYGVSVEEGVVYYLGEAVHGVLVNRILQFMEEKLPVKPLVKFLSNLMLNPSKRAVDELYTFLEHKTLPITEDGCFLAYKRVDENWKDFHTGKFDNHVGNVLEMPRNQVCDNKDNNCSFGFHVGSLEYVRNFNSGGHVLVCKVNPCNVVSVPVDSNCQKLRTCKYEVIAEFTQELEKPLYNKQGKEYNEEPTICITLNDPKWVEAHKAWLKNKSYGKNPTPNLE